jgi:hypothetical protein
LMRLHGVGRGRRRPVAGRRGAAVVLRRRQGKGPSRGPARDLWVDTEASFRV